MSADGLRCALCDVTFATFGDNADMAVAAFQEHTQRHVDQIAPITGRHDFAVAMHTARGTA